MKKEDIKILYFGTPDISAIVLEQLLKNNYHIVGLVAQVDKEKNRKGILLPVPTKQIANTYNIPVYQFEKIRDHIDEIKNIDFDIILTMAYGQIIPTSILELAPYGAYNLHGSLLPKYRGAAPIQYALLNGDKETGVTLMEMIKEMDAGKMFYKVKVNIEDDDNFTSLSNKIAFACYKAFDEGIEDVVNKKNLGIEQNIEDVTFTSKISSDLEKIDFNQSAFKILNIVRALSNNIGGYFIYNGEKIKIYKVYAFLLNEKTIPGRIRKYDKNNFHIETGDGYLDIKVLQRPGKKVLSYKDFYNGNKELFKVGEIIR